MRVKDSFRYDPLNPRLALESKALETFLLVTGEPLVEYLKRKKLARAGKAQELRLYRGATPDDPV